MNIADYPPGQKTQTVICKSIRRARCCLNELSCPQECYCQINRAVCAAREESITRTKEWLANNCNAIEPTIKDEEMGIL
jgi:hypothetical protein